MSLLTILIASILGSPHCGAMCGGFVTLYAADGPASNLSHVAYNVGRLLTYLILGFLAGLIGAQLDVLALQADLMPVSAMLMGGMLVIWGLLVLCRGGVQARSALHMKVTSRIMAILNTVSHAGSWQSAFAIGLCSTLLPCGWLYSFVLVAAASGSPWNGAVIMFVFWLGTVPMMALIGKTVHVLTAKWGSQLPYLTATLMIIAGIFAMTGKLSPEIFGHHHHHH